MKSDYQVIETAAGFRLALARLPASECAALSIHLGAGSRDDPAGLGGLAHFVEHMVFKGTRRRTALEVSVETEDAGASLNAGTGEDQTTYEARGDAATLPLLADVLAELVWDPVFPEHEVDVERDVISEEIVLYEETPSDHISDLLSQAMWSPDPLGAPVAGTLESIRSIGRDDLVGFRERHHFQRDTVIAVAGPFTVEEVLAALADRLPEARGTASAPPTAATAVEPEGPRPPLVTTRDTHQVQLALGFPVFGRRDPRRHALRMLSMILAEGWSSRLFQTLREQRGLCYHVCSDIGLFEDRGSFEIHSGLDPESLDEALECIRGEIDDLASRGPRPAEVERARRLAGSQLRASMESTGSHASWIGECLLQHDQLVTPAEALARLEPVTPKQIRDLAAEFLAADRAIRAEIRPA